MAGDLAACRRLRCSPLAAPLLRVGTRDAAGPLVALGLGLVDVDDDHRDVVDAAGSVGGPDQPVGRFLRVGRGLEDRLDLVFGDHARQAVAAEQEAVAVDQGDVVLVDDHFGFGAERARQHVSVGWTSASCGVISPAFTMRLHEGVVVGELAEVAGAQQVGAAVADVREVAPRSVDDAAVSVVPMPDHLRSEMRALEHGAFASRICSASVAFPPRNSVLDRLEREAARRRRPPCAPPMPSATA